MKFNPQSVVASFMSSILPSALAADGSAGAPGFTLFEPLLLVGIIAVFYFLIWRPQSKRAREHRELVASLAKDDEVVTSGGIVGKICEVQSDHVIVRIAKNTDIRIQKNAVSATYPKGTLKSLEEKT